jgi:L-lactate dehydrogenase (cytochrome)
MHDMTARVAAISGHNRSPNFLKHQRWYPTIYDLRQGSRARLPRFAFEYGDGGAGADTGIKRNWNALDAIEMVPRYGVMPELPPVGVELFGRKYTAPIGIAPMGSPIVVWPGAAKLFAAAAQRVGVPYTLGCAGGATIEEIAAIAPDVFWFQLYRFAKNNHAIGFELVKRCEAAGVKVLMLTLDVPVRTIRAREVKVGLGGGGAFKADWRMVAGMAKCPGWAVAMLKNGQPRFANIQPYAYREKWKGPLVVKGIMHPADAERAVSLGCDGVLVSNHGGRQIEALPAPIDCVPAVVRAVGSKATVLFDSGVRSGTDVARALALGAQAALAGKAFLWSLGALGAEGPGHAIDLFIDELQSALGQIGAHSPAESRNVMIRHPGAYDFGRNHP